MRFLVVLIAFVLWVQGQEEIDEETRRRIAEIFPNGNANTNTNTNTNAGNTNTNTGNGEYVPVGYDEVTQANLNSFGAADKCGEGSTQGTHMCVSYHMCDGKTNTIVQTGVTDGFGKIDIRFGANTCTHPLDVCCQLPKGGLDPNLPQPGSEATPVTPGTVPVTPSVVDDRTPPDTPISKPSYCGLRNTNGIDFKLTGNRDNEAEYGEFPWMVAIVNKDSLSGGNQQPLVCGGSLITPNVVLTGAHCVARLKTSDIIVRAGEWDTQTMRERLPYQDINIRQIIVNSGYNPGNLHNDFALLILQDPVAQAENVGTVCLPAQRQRIISKNCFVTGWGKDEFGRKGKFQSILKKIELPIVPNSQCQAALRTTRLGSQFELDQSFICAGGEKGKDACTGDGGSPLICPDPQNPNRYMQVGIVAWGIGCGDQDIPGVYGDVSQFRSWIDQELRRLNINDSPYIA